MKGHKELFKSLLIKLFDKKTGNKKLIVLQLILFIIFEYFCFYLQLLLAEKLKTFLNN